jgi:hypothetical protein
MADRARRPIEVGFSAAVMVEEAAYVVAGRPQVDTCGMTLLATKRRLDLVMAYQAVRHTVSG